jgi:hypothetical protein
MAAQEHPLTLPHVLLWVQGAYYLLTGVWPLVSIRTFIWVTGQKTDHLKSGLEIDHWLVMTAGVLITAIGLGIVVAAARRSLSAEIVTVAVGAAVGLTAIDVIYNWRGMIGPMYLVDAVLQILLIAAWSVALLFNRPAGAART